MDEGGGTVDDGAREIAVSLRTPDPAWEGVFEEIHVAGEELVVLSRVRRDPEILAPQVISEASHRVRVRAPDYPVRHYVLGRTWGWDSPEIRFIEDRDEIESLVREGRRVYPEGGRKK